MSGEQLLLHREANPGSGFAHICLYLTDVLNVSAKKTTVQGVGQKKQRIYIYTNKQSKDHFLSCENDTRIHLVSITSVLP